MRSLKEIRETGVVMQHWDNSCGAAALATVLTYGFGHPISEEQVAEAMLPGNKPSEIRKQGGFSFLDMKHVVERIGFKGLGFKKMTIPYLKKYRDPIVLIVVHGYPHFVVFEGVKGDRVLLADPAYGKRSPSQRAFKTAWHDGFAFVVTR